MKSHRKGFTLVELLVVIAIISLLLAILMPVLARVLVKVKAKVSEVAENNTHVRTALHPQHNSLQFLWNYIQEIDVGTPLVKIC